MLDKNHQRSRLVAQFHPPVPLRVAVGLLGLLLIGFTCFQWHSDGASNLALAALLVGTAFIILGLLGQVTLGRLTLEKGDTKFSIEPEQESLREPPRAFPVTTAPLEYANNTRIDDPLPEVIADSPTSTDDKPSPFSLALDALLKKDWPTYDARMQEAISQEHDEDKRLLLQSRRLANLYASGDAHKLDELQTLRRSHPTSPHPVRLLALSYGFVGDYSKAAQVFQEACHMESLSDEDRFDFTLSYAGELTLLKRFPDAETLLLPQIETAPSDSARAKLQKQLAELYEAWGKNDIMNWHLEAALDVNPADREVRFKLAYTYDEIGYRHAALYHYNILRSQTNRPGVLNNLAIILKYFDMPVTAVAYYRRDIDNGEPLAAANLARHLVASGLTDEATSVLSPFVARQDAPSLVHTAAAELASQKDTEEKRLPKILEAGEAERRLFRLRIDSEKAQSPITQDKLPGTWTTSVGTITFNQEEQRLRGHFKEGIWDWELFPRPEGRAITFDWTCDKIGENQRGDGFFVFTSDDGFQGIIRDTPNKGDARLVDGRRTQALQPPPQTGSPLDEILRAQPQ